MRGVWRNSVKYFNFDRHTDNCYIYGDKFGGAIFELEAIDRVIVTPVEDSTGVFIFPTIARGEIKISIPGKARIKVLNLEDKILADYYLDSELIIRMNYENEMYFIGIQMVQLTHKAVYKVVLCR